MHFWADYKSKTQIAKEINGTEVLEKVQEYRRNWLKYRGADKSLARPGKKQATATEDFEFHISYL